MPQPLDPKKRLHDENVEPEKKPDLPAEPTPPVEPAEPKAPEPVVEPTPPAPPVAETPPAPVAPTPPTPPAMPKVNKPGWLETNIPTLHNIIQKFKKKKTETPAETKKPEMLTPKGETKEVLEAEQKKSFLQKYLPSLAGLLKKDKPAMEAAYPTKQVPEGRKETLWNRFLLRIITKKDRLFFLDQLTTLVNSDIRLVDGLRLLKQQSNRKRLKLLLTRMIGDIEKGTLLSESMEKYPQVFPSMWPQLIKAGESSGQLAVILQKMNEQQTNQQRLMGNIKSALLYPAFIVVMIIVLMTVMMTTIVPQIESIYQQARVDLPGITQFIINASRFTVAYGAYIAIGTVIFLSLCIMGVRRLYYMKKGWDFFNLRWPVFGELNKLRNLIFFADNVQLLLSSGILLTDALAIASDIVPSINYKEEILRIRDKINHGENMSKAMGLIDIVHEKFEDNFYFPLQFAQMINVGEQTGNTNSVLEKIKLTYSDKVQTMVKNLSTLLEPIMIIIVGGMVGVFLLGIMLPFFSLGKVVRGL